MVDNNLYENLLPPVMYIKGLIQGKDENYENYLREFLNNSLYFYKKSNGVEYKAPVKEDAGECDCYADGYGLDFKLFGSQSMFYAKGNLSAQMIVDDGVIIGTASKKDGSMTSSILHKVLRFYNFDTDTLTLPNNDGNEDMYLDDLKRFKNVLLKKKNLLCFYPYELYFKNDYNFNYALTEIKTAIEKDFINAFQYREKMCPGLETYFSFIYSDFFVIMKYENNKLNIVDFVNTGMSKTYSRMYFSYVI